MGGRTSRRTNKRVTMFRLFTRDEVKPRNLKNTFIWGGREYNYAITNDNLHIKDSYTISKKGFAAIFDVLKERHASGDVWKRSYGSLRREWAVHNLCYVLNIKREQTADVDLNFPQTAVEKIAYGLLGPIALIFVK